MKLENQVCSLELSKKLKELGVKQDSLFYWVKSGLKIKCVFGCFDMIENIEEYYSAFTVAELLNFNPYYLTDNKGNKHNLYTQITKNIDNEFCVFSSCLSLFNIANIVKRNISDAVANNLIYLIENGYVKI